MYKPFPYRLLLQFRDSGVVVSKCNYDSYDDLEIDSKLLTFHYSDGPNLKKTSPSLGRNHVHLTVRLGFVTQHLWLGNFGKCN